jgi:hypothetical protein
MLTEKFKELAFWRHPSLSCAVVSHVKMMAGQCGRQARSYE